MFSLAGRKARSPRDVARECRLIASGALDDVATRTAVSAYHAEAKSKDYQGTWQKRLNLILDVIEGGETNLSRVLSLVARRVEGARQMDFGEASYVAFDRLVQLPSRGAQKLHRGVIAEAVCDLCTDATESIIELGSGWGEHICSLWNEGAPRDASYHALEIAESGRKCALVLASLEPRLRLEALHFNYVRPDFSALRRARKEVVAFSVQSIEQVKEVPMEFITGLCGLGEKVRCVHFEPIGWQMVAESDRSPLARSHQERCAAKGYNADYWSLLQRAQSEGLITILKSVPNFFGQEHNPTSYIVWESRLAPGRAT
jgi:hypothetical protein